MPFPGLEKLASVFGDSTEDEFDAKIKEADPVMWEGIQSGNSWALQEKERLRDIYLLDKRMGTNYLEPNIKSRSSGLSTKRWLLGSE